MIKERQPVYFYIPPGMPSTLAAFLFDFLSDAGKRPTISIWKASAHVTQHAAINVEAARVVDTSRFR